MLLRGCLPYAELLRCFKIFYFSYFSATFAACLYYFVNMKNKTKTNKILQLISSSPTLCGIKMTLYYFGYGFFGGDFHKVVKTTAAPATI